ncbi:MAG: hypothetical protein J1F35_06585 [Erysipelotrichales bacterium]|nr:hypothetical protein [Erysipelotrichales bacterium]
MKIISKFQDFYEFDCYRYGEPSMTPSWHRVEGQKEIIVDSNIAEKINSLFICKNHSIRFDYKGRYHYSRRNGFLEPVNIESQIIGIYPYTYYIPKVYFNKTIENDDPNTINISKTKKVQIYLSAQDSLDILSIKDSFKDIMSKYGVSYKDFCYPEDIVNPIKRNWWNKNTNKEVCNKDKMITEFPELFDIVGEPIISFNNGIEGIFNRWKKYVLKVNINENLSKTDLLSYYPEIITERDVYTELENYLISRHQEPISEPDNKTKITSHGFDLKTSFRNM